MANRYLLSCDAACLSSGHSKVSEKQLKEYYDTYIDKDIAVGGYPDFDCWLQDMLKMDLIQNIRDKTDNTVIEQP